MRKLILVSSGLLFMIAAGGLVLIGSGEGDNMFVIMSSAAVPFLFTAYWNFFSVYYENRTNSSEGYFTYKSVSNTGIGVLYNKAIVVPFFLVLFGAAAIAVLTSFLVLNSSTEDAAIAAAGAGFLYSLVITIYFTIKICRGLKDENTLRTEKSADNTGFKIAFFFASFATLGLFPLIYFSVKYLKKKDANH